MVPDATKSARAAGAGEFVFAGGGADDDGPRARSFYAWAVAPRAWVEQVWGDAGFAIEQWVPTGELFDQAMAVLVRQEPGWKRPRASRNIVRRGARKLGRGLSKLRSRA